MTDTPKTYLTPECGYHCGAQRIGHSALLVGHCKCEDCDCPHKTRVLTPEAEKAFT